MYIILDVSFNVLHLNYALINVILFAYDCELCLRTVYRNLCNALIHILLLQVSQSNARTVALQDVQRELTGFYKCEVSADAPLFHTEIKTGLMIVVGKIWFPGRSTCLSFSVV